MKDFRKAFGLPIVIRLFRHCEVKFVADTSDQIHRARGQLRVSYDPTFKKAVMAGLCQIEAFQGVFEIADPIGKPQDFLAETGTEQTPIGVFWEVQDGFGQMEGKFDLVGRIEFGLVVDGAITGSDIVIELKHRQHGKTAGVFLLLPWRQNNAGYFSKRADRNAHCEAACADRGSESHDALCRTEEISHQIPRLRRASRNISLKNNGLESIAWSHSAADSADGNPCVSPKPKSTVRDRRLSQ